MSPRWRRLVHEIKSRQFALVELLAVAAEDVGASAPPPERSEPALRGSIPAGEKGFEHAWYPKDRAKPNTA
jgi:hypothetical protein